MAKIVPKTCPKHGQNGPKLLKGTFFPQPSLRMSKVAECSVVLNVKQCSLSYGSQIAAQCLGAQCPGAGCPGAHCLGAQCP